MVPTCRPSHSGAIGNTGRDWAVTYNGVQAFAIQQSRLHIPVLFGVDAVHGFGHPVDAPLFPHAIGMGATWDPAVAELGGGVTGAALRSTGWVEDFAPVQDVFRDNRWGRSYEPWSEAPVLAGALGAANVRGLQSAPDNSTSNPLRVAATVKHFAGYSQSINGHDRVEGQLPIRDLQDVFLPAYKDGVDAGAKMVMVSSSSINGVPATASKFLQTTLLRERLGFTGVTISDFNDVQSISTAYHTAPDLAGAIAKAVNAGLDMAMWVDNPDQWQSSIQAALQTGQISESRIDASVRRILTLKFQLGLFDQPCVTDFTQPCVDPEAGQTAVQAGRDATLQAARESMTLLKNTGNVLPLPRTAQVLVTGPNADSMVGQLGGWSVSWQGVSSSGHSCCEGPPGQIPPGTTVRKAIEAADPNTTFVAVSPAVTSGEQAAAVSAAAGSDVVVAVVGELAYAEGIGDDPAPALRPDQKALLAALEATGRPVVMVVMAGRPIGLGATNELNANAIVMAYQGSTEAGQAVADVIFGDVNPSGKLPISWPSDADVREPFGRGADFNAGAPSPIGDQPKYFDQLPSTSGGTGNAYNPLYPFGFGLSYTTFTTESLSIVAPGGGDRTISATFTVTNTGRPRGDRDRAWVFVHRASSDATVPPHRLVGFARVPLDTGQARTLQVDFPSSVLAVTPGDIDSTAPPQVERGIYTLEVPTQVQPGNLFPTQEPATHVDFSIS